ncbi:MAG: thiamine-phosphate kinase [Sulfurimonas sp.]|uniref:thiamine-phosphate kinase n=1 Tax=Sulfurimonas sp. TaxID=2022749 RepID=UPI0025F98361|nr:thiamine-phosphate kinase [Sulfurimonas sp.]MCK9453629.1 thiamine-phosphate kinase [Sulfurimonas sp.]
MNLENYFISQFKNAHIGDDGALIDDTVYSKDAFFEGIHFKREWMSYYQIAAKAMSVNISDAIAMNAKPKYALLSVAMPPYMTMAQMRELVSGFQETAAKYGIEIIGGDTIKNTKLDITVTVVSKTIKPLMRKGLRRGHMVAYSGELGRSAKDLKRLLNLGNIHKNSKFVNIKLRDKFVSKCSRYLSCGMDISDGLFSDLGKLSSVNRMGFKFCRHVPKRVGCSGEEYEMLFAFDKRNTKSVLRVAKLCRTPITIVAQSVRKSYKNRCKAHHF